MIEDVAHGQSGVRGRRRHGTWCMMQVMTLAHYFHPATPTIMVVSLVVVLSLAIFLTSWWRDRTRRRRDGADATNGVLLIWLLAPHDMVGGGGRRERALCLGGAGIGGRGSAAT